MPQGSGFDPERDRLTVDLLSMENAVLSIDIDPGSMELQRSTAKYSGTSQTPAEGAIRLKVRPSKSGNTYSLLVSGRGLDMSGATASMDLRVNVGSHAVSQTFDLRNVRGKLLYP